MSKAPDSLSNSVLKPQDRFRFLATNATVALCASIIGYVMGLLSGHSDLVAVRATAQQLQIENQKMKGERIETDAKLAELASNLANARAALEAISPKQNTYNLLPNQSLIVADGRLTIGLIGYPTNESVLININGKQQSAASGETIRVSPDASTNCQVRIQSFDMFKALFGASCTETKP